jgi:uncharacterized membrane protein YbhN (UPF0104 family)
LTIHRGKRFCDKASDEGQAHGNLGPAVTIKRAARTLLATLLVALVLVALLWFGDFHKILTLIGRFRRVYLIWFMLLLAAYEVVRGLLWHVLMGALVVRVPARTLTFAFAGGEAAKFVPTGAYLQNYMLQRFAGVDFVNSSAATTWMILAEIVVALLGVVVFGVGGWSGPLRLAIAIVLVAAIWAARIYLARTPASRGAGWQSKNVVLRRIHDAMRRFRESTTTLSQPWILGITLILTAAYLILAGAGLYAVLRGLGITDVSFWQATGVSCFGLAFYVILGSLEAAEVGAFIGIGVNKSDAVSAIIITRGLSVGGTLLMALLVLVVLRDQWRPGGS